MNKRAYIYRLADGDLIVIIASNGYGVVDALNGRGIDPETVRFMGMAPHIAEGQ